MTNIKTEELDLAFYKFAAYCYTEGLNIMFKGGCLLRHILHEQNINVSDVRKTVDIDFEASEQAYLHLKTKCTHLLEIKELRQGIMCDAVLFDGDADCDIHVVVNDEDLRDKKKYTGPFGLFYGSSVERIMTDKVSAMSSRSVARRHKDLFDIYILAKNSNKVFIDIERLRELLGQSTLGSFDNFVSDAPHIAKGLKNVLSRMGTEITPEDVMTLCDIYVKGLLSPDCTLWTGREWI